MSSYRYDSDVRELVARTLYGALPALYRVQDERADAPEALLRFLRVLGAPAAVLRQNIEELHADLFIDTGHDHIIPLLADMVGTSLVFPDADANRRDVRGTIAWRKRKGSLRMLQQMGEELTAQLVVAQEGWKRLQLAQDLNLLRIERTLPDLRPALVAEQAAGPLDALFHAADLRSISAATGRYHPKQIIHWIYPTLTFPLRRASAFPISLPGSDQRFVMHPLGETHPLRVRGTSLHPLASDRVPALHFAAQPADWFGVEGRFVIEICDLPAGIAALAPSERVASIELVDPELVRGTVTITLLDHNPRAFHGRMVVEVGSAPFVSVGPDTWVADVSAFTPSAAVALDSAGSAGSLATPSASAGRAVLLRVRPPVGIGGRFFPGATLEIAGGEPAARSATRDAELAREGFLRGAVHVELPPLQVTAERFLFIAADGSLYDAHDPASGTPTAEMPEQAGRRVLSRRRLAQAGPGAAWPPLPARSDPTFMTDLPAAPGRGPSVMHGGIPLRRTLASFDAVPAATESALVFAMRVEQGGTLHYRPFQQLTWSGSDPSSATWHALSADGLPVPGDAASVSTEYAAVAALREQSRSSFPLAVRFECSRSDVSLSPAEVAWTSHDGTTLLIHLPELNAQSASSEAWPRDLPRFPAASVPVRVAEDGSTWSAGSSANLRQSLGPVAPLRDSSALRRRRVRWRRLCAWKNEDWGAIPPRVLAATRPGWLDVDVEHGLFALAAEDVLQAWPRDALGMRPESVTSSFEEGATMHVGARPDAREPVLDEQLAQPTRIVSGSGHLSANAPAERQLIPRYHTLSEALRAISNEWSSLTPADIPDFATRASFERREVVQIEDSATYIEAPLWPAAPVDASVAQKAHFSLTLQAAERERPLLCIDPAQGFTLPAAPALLSELTLLGLALGAPGWTGMLFPPVRALRIALCSILYAENRLTLAIDEHSRATLSRCELAGLALLGTGHLTVRDSLIDAGNGSALQAASGVVELERVTVGGTVAVHELHASEVIFDDRVTVEDRFRGCIRYSRAPLDSVLPRAHRCQLGVRVGYVTLDRHDAAFRRLRADADPRILRGAENGSEMGAFSSTRHAERIAAFEQREREYTPAGLTTGIVRLD